MAEIRSLLTQTTTDGKKIEPMAKLSSFGSIIGLIAGVIGLIAGGVALLPLSNVASIYSSNINDPGYSILSLAFVGLLAVSLLLQTYGSKEIREKTGASLAQVNWLTLLFALLLVINILGAPEATSPQQLETLVGNLALYTSMFLIFWQIGVTFYVDTSKTWIGTIAGVLNALVFPIMALGVVLGPGLYYASYIILIAGQFMGFLYYRSPTGAFREYARSPEKAKFAFGLVGFLSVLIGTAAVLIGPIAEIVEDGYDPAFVWRPWGAMSSSNVLPFTNPALVQAFLMMLMTWIFLAPRLGAKELKKVDIGDDIVKGGLKALMILMAFVGILFAGQAGTAIQGAVEGSLFFMTISGPAILFFMGALYVSTTDVITGLPLVVASIFMLLSPHTLLLTVLIPWAFVVLSQFVLMIETRVRGLTAFSVPWATVVVSSLASLALIIILLGMLGVGPPAIWPTNLWYNMELIPGIPVWVQAPTILIFPLIAIVIRNLTLSGFAHKGGYGATDTLGGLTVLFVLLIPTIAGNDDLSHMALTAASIMFALYALTLVIVLSLNLNIAGEVEEKGHKMEGGILRMTAIVGIAAGALVAIVALAVFSGFPSSQQVAIVITLLVTLVVSLEILSIIGWIIGGIRLGFLKEGWKFERNPEQ
ncbi:MAG: hypothetical protein GF411_13690 [Candidatus Lokiarchaeota archaeon]|nr:hypothetical protein [Candidatus Lokiarchaeota archaeon]